MNDLSSPSRFLHGVDAAATLQVKTWPRAPKSINKLRVVDLFCGCGGLSLGAFQACIETSMSFEVALALDNCLPATNVYSENLAAYGRSALIEDITQFVQGSDHSRLSQEGRNLLKSVGKVDVLLAGPPCQGNSSLNNNSRRNDPRNDLYIVPAVFAAKS